MFFSGKLLDFSPKYQVSNCYQIRNLKDNTMKLFLQITLLFLISKIYFFARDFLFWWESQILGKGRWKSRVKTGKNCHYFQGNQEQLFQFCPGRIGATLLHIHAPNYPSFHLKCPRKCQKPISLTFSQHFSKLAPLPLSSFVVDLKFDHIPLCVYY